VNIAPRSRTRGYTAVELLTTLSVVGIVTALAVPNMQQFMLNNRTAADANALIGALNIARNEAVTRGIPVSVCASADGQDCSGAESWNTGWIVFTDAVAPVGQIDGGAEPDTVLQVFPGLTGGSELEADTAVVSYQPNGFLTGAAAGFELQVSEHCMATGNLADDEDESDRLATNRRQIAVNPQGRVAVTRVPCP
jgi:type IV fimbrial biogenesis protein FimT